MGGKPVISELREGSDTNCDSEVAGRGATAAVMRDNAFRDKPENKPSSHEGESELSVPAPLLGARSFKGARGVIFISSHLN